MIDNINTFDPNTDGMDKRIRIIKSIIEQFRKNEFPLDDKNKEIVRTILIFRPDPKSKLPYRDQKYRFKRAIHSALTTEEVLYFSNLMEKMVPDKMLEERMALLRILDKNKQTPLNTLERKEFLSKISTMPEDARAELLDSLSSNDLEHISTIAELDKKEHPKVEEDARIFQGIEQWIKSHDLSIIQKNEAPRAHKVAEAYLNDRIYPLSFPQREQSKKVMIEIFTKVPSIVVKHNWMAAIGEDLREKDGDTILVTLPYPSVLFEFMVHGKCVIMLASEQTDGRIALLPYIEFEKDKWFVCSENDQDLMKLYDALREQIEAICVALTVKIADKEEVQPPAAVNKKRIKNNKPPLGSYHVVDLSKRFQDKKLRSGARSDDHGPKVRLHWRRRHIRHFKDGKPPIWIDWMLVGDIDLGFIDKHYLA